METDMSEDKQYPAPHTQVMGMDEEDRTPVPEGFDAAQWQKADEVFHAASLVAHDAECVKIIYGALSAAFRDGIDEALQIATDQARLMADLAVDGLPENARQREAMEAALTRFSQSLRVTLEGLAAPTPSAVAALQAIADLPTAEKLDRMNGHEDAYRAIEKLFDIPPHIEANPSPQTKARGID
jgi:hypothetical protein